MTRRHLLASLAALALVASTACGGGSDSPTAPSLPPTGTAPFGITDLRAGTGSVAVAGQAVTVNYTGWLYSNTAAENKGSQFDSNRNVRFQLGANVIAGWSQGIPGMRVGGLRRLVIPPELAYGSSTPDSSRIPPNATLLFEVELVSVP
ncbi:MAG: FKBP-type peptidyl-prolyl cis-trans isomerase [Acidobacteria bacterium]|nr:FKBP-type peptidyl-prolyl cis-trans isomerase [Acidobacteriota bacterium]